MLVDEVAPRDCRRIGRPSCHPTSRFVTDPTLFRFARGTASAEVNTQHAMWLECAECRREVVSYLRRQPVSIGDELDTARGRGVVVDLSAYREGGDRGPFVRPVAIVEVCTFKSTDPAADLLEHLYVVHELPELR